MTEATEPAEATTPKKTARERFFAIDARSWPKVCELGMPAAVSYLVLACGTGGDQVTTRWSVDAIERHTGIGRPRAKAAVAALADAGLIRIEKGGSRPRYSMVHAHQAGPASTLLTAEEERILQIIAAGNNAVPKVGRYTNVWGGGKPYETACSLARKGRLRDKGGFRFELVDVAPAVPDAPDLIWLPSNLVESGEGGDRTPLEAIRQTHNIRALRLLIDLYHAHDLINEPGINWRPGQGLRLEFERVKLGEYGPHVVWGFKKLHSRVALAAPYCAPHLVDKPEERNSVSVFFETLDVLQSLHLVEPVFHLVDSYTKDGEVMWPLPGRESAGEPCEKAVTRAALLAASAMLTAGQVEWGNNQGIVVTAPVFKHIAEVQAVGIYRLRHRPNTEATSLWYSRLVEECAAVQKRYEEITALINPNVQHQGEIKDLSKVASRMHQRGINVPLSLVETHVPSSLRSDGRRPGGSAHAQEVENRSLSPPRSGLRSGVP